MNSKHHSDGNQPEEIQGNGAHDHEQHSASPNTPAGPHHSHSPLPHYTGGAKRNGMIWGVLIVAALLALGIAPRIKQQKRLDLTTANLSSDVVPVNVVAPRPSGKTTTLVLPSNVQAIEETTIHARTSGYLSQRFVDFGSHVKAGQTLAIIESPEVDQELLAARAESSHSVAQGQQAQADVTRLQANVAQARADQAQTEANLEAARAEQAHAQAKLLEAKSTAAEAAALLIQAEKKLNGRHADLKRAQTHLGLSKKTYDRWQELARGGAISGQDLDEAQANYESDQSNVSAAQADVDSAQADLTAAQETVRARNGDVEAAKADVLSATQKINAAQSAVVSSQASVQASKANVQAGKANVQAANANIASSEANVNRYAALRSFERVTAPFDGVITARNVDVGSLINAGSGASGGASDPLSTVPRTGLFGIARTDTLRIQVSVPQTFVGSIQQGQKAQIRIQELPGRVFTGTVFDTAGALDATSRTLLTEVRLKNPNNRLIPGMYAQVEFILPQAHPTLRVPANTLIINGAGTHIAIVTPDQKVHLQEVQLGRDFGKEVEILNGLNGDERLITDPSDDLVEGTPVKIVHGP